MFVPIAQNQEVMNQTQETEYIPLKGNELVKKCHFIKVNEEFIPFNGVIGMQAQNYAIILYKQVDKIKNQNTI